MLCTAPDVCLAMILSRGTEVIQEWITGQRSRLSLVTKRTKEIFLDNGGDKEFVVKGYVDASFDTNPDNTE